MRYTMREQDAWQFELDAYIREGEPGRAQRAANWQTAIGLQAVDGLQISSYLLETAKAHIEGFIGVAEARQRIDDYYKAARASRKNVEGFEEADTVSSRMAELLGERAFTFSPAIASHPSPPVCPRALWRRRIPHLQHHEKRMGIEGRHGLLRIA